MANEPGSFHFPLRRRAFGGERPRSEPEGSQGGPDQQEKNDNKKDFDSSQHNWSATYSLPVRGFSSQVK